MPRVCDVATLRVGVASTLPLVSLLGPIILIYGSDFWEKHLEAVPTEHRPQSNCNREGTIRRTGRASPPPPPYSEHTALHLAQPLQQH